MTFQGIKEYVPAIIAVGGILSAVVYIPNRVSSIEDHDRQQDVRIEAIERDAAQRRELLASVAAIVSQIDARTRRIEDVITRK
jgi:hypothetical protein